MLDAACGTGMHAVAFARRGREAAGADLSPVMIERARQNARDAGVSVDFRVAGFGACAGAWSAPFDAVTCIGNSLPHLPDDASLSRCLADFAAALRPGGTLVIQNRNYDRVLRERQRFMPLSTRQTDGGETLFLRITDFPGAAAEERIDFTIVTLTKTAGAWSQTVRTTPLRALRRATLEAALASAGFAAIRVYGNYAMAPFDSPDAGDLVIVART
jgi:glycine/sarcosine N-methyltransferase